MHPDAFRIEEWFVSVLKKQVEQEHTEQNYEDTQSPSSLSYGRATTNLLLSAKNIETTDWLTRLADELILSYPHALVPERCRLLYIDAAICAALIILKADSSINEESRMNIIHKLDKALIVAGPHGERFNYIHKLIKMIQNGAEQKEPNAKRQRLSPSNLTTRKTTDQEKLPIHTPIPRYTLDDAPSLDQFDTPLLSPFIITNALEHWPALNDHPWKDIQYISSVAGPYRIVPVESGSSYTLPDWTQKIIPFEEFLSSLSESSTSSTSPHIISASDQKTMNNTQHISNVEEGREKKPLYLAQHDLFRQFPALLNDTVTPDLVFSAPPVPPYFQSYQPPQNDLGYTMNAWFGPRGTFSPAHTDPYYNCYAQVVGRKWIWIAPPDLQREMYPYGSDNNPDNDDNNNTAPAKENNDGDGSTTLDMMQNTSRVNVRLAPDSHQNKFPLFSNVAAPRALQAILEPGDLLFMPPKWWHSMESLDVSFSVSYWF